MKVNVNLINRNWNLLLQFIVCFKNFCRSLKLNCKQNVHAFFMVASNCIQQDCCICEISTMVSLIRCLKILNNSPTPINMHFKGILPELATKEYQKQCYIYGVCYAQLFIIFGGARGTDPSWILWSYCIGFSLKKPSEPRWYHRPFYTNEHLHAQFEKWPLDL